MSLYVIFQYFWGNIVEYNITGNLTVHLELIKTNNKVNIKTPHNWPFVRGIYQWLVVSLLIFQCCTESISCNVWERYLYGFSKVPFESPHKIPYPHIERCLFFKVENSRVLRFKCVFQAILLSDCLHIQCHFRTSSAHHAVINWFSKTNRFEIPFNPGRNDLNSRKLGLPSGSLFEAINFSSRLR